MTQLAAGRFARGVANDLFVGRERACQLLDAFVASVRSGGAARVLAGEVGMGKTALLHHLAQRSQVPVRWLRGIEAEAVLPFAAAADLLTPLRPYFGAVPATQRRALERALALADGAPPCTLAIYAGALGVLAAAGDEGPLLIFVDDFQWIDAESRQLLLFAARRLTTERVGILFALREGDSEQSVVHDLPVLRLNGLTPTECEELARRRNLRVRPQELHELVRATGGNPLAVIETLARRKALPDACAAGTEVDRADRLLAAATDSLLAGRAAQAERWCAEALTLRSDPRFAATVAGLRGRALMWMGETRLAADELMRAAEAVRDDDKAMAARLLHEAVMPIAMSGDVERCFQAAVQSEALVPGELASFHGRVMIAAAYLLHGALEQGRRRLELAELLRPDVDPVSEQHALAIMAEAYWWLEDFESAKQLITSTVEVLRQRGTSTALAFALIIRSDVGFRTGQWSSAYADATEALGRAEEMQQLGMIGYSLVTMARIEAARGQRGSAEEHIDLSVRRAGSSGTDSLLVYQAAALGLSAMTHRQPEVAVEHLENAWQLATGHGLGHPGVVPFPADLVEAHIRCGNARRATELLEWLQERGDKWGLVYAAAAAHRCRGLLACGIDEAISEFAAARAAHARSAMPFELARTLLCQGEVLRRARHPTEARTALREAHRIFGALGAQPWADRTGMELIAAGAAGRAPARDAFAGLDALTPQELQIARAVASGRNNVEVSAALYVSRKTVEAHLTRIYRKLGIRSRVDLTRVLLARGITD
jgi:DNA-binding CsgD family transcriptional regulator